MSKPTVLVTGANGFIGSHLCPELVAAGYRVRGAIRAADRPLAAGVEPVVIGDIATADWDTAMAGADCVVHLAGLAHQVSSRGDDRGDEYHRTNADATRFIALAARDAVRRVIYLSSVGAIHPKPAIGGSARLDDYGESKLEGERSLRETLEGSDTDWCIIRPPLVYGMGNKGNMLRLERLVASGIPLPLGSIRNLRSLVYVGNLTSAILAAIDHPAVSRRVFVVCDAESLSTPDLLRRVGRYSGRPVRLWNAPVQSLAVLGRAGDLVARLLRRRVPVDTYSVQRLCGSLVVDGSEFERLTGWRPPYSVDRGLELTFRPATGRYAPGRA